MARLLANVRVQTDTGEQIVLLAGDDLPSWARSQITNEDVLTGDADEAPEPQPESEPEADSTDPVGTVPVDYSELKVTELRDLIVARNDGRPDDELIPVSGTKAELVAALEQSDRA